MKVAAEVWTERDNTRSGDVEIELLDGQLVSLNVLADGVVVASATLDLYAAGVLVGALAAGSGR